ncbi:MAG TPA: calcium-binding protein [Pirellulales bacterium]|jgi:Ca2+-binding RTX toxin-like protein|nr:calcium-binding protein [Pirellulales bacterium]
MSRNTFNQWVGKLIRGGQKKQKPRSPRRIARLEQLGERITPTVNAFAFGGVLTVVGDNADNTIEVSRNAAGNLLVNGGDVKIFGATPTVANTSQVNIFGLGGNDQLSLNETNGALPRANLYGGSGNDVLIGGSAADFIFGQAGNDMLLGKGGDDFLFGGAGDDTLTGGAGDDKVFGEAGNDRMIWNPGDGTDLNEGGAGNDTVEVNGGNGAETFTVTPNGTRVRFDRTSPAPFSIDIGTSENLVVNMNGGDDTFTASNGLATLISIAVDGGTGNDTITGGDGNDRLIGGDGNDTINGGRGNDTIVLGAGDDTFVWNPGDGSDVVNGQDGYDTMIFNGASGNENVEISANGSHVRFVRDVGGVTMDLSGLEQIDFNALGGVDNVTVDDLRGTDLTTLNLNLAAALGGTAGDNAVDTVTINGSDAEDAIAITGTAGNVTAVGLGAAINITGAEPALDRLVVNGRDGDDVVDASGLDAVAIQLTINGGAGDDVLMGGAGADRINGNEGDDLLFGGPGVDILDGGPGSNTLFQD